MRWAAPPQTLISDSQLYGSGRSSRHLHLVGRILGVIASRRLGSRFLQDAPLASPAGANLPTVFAGFETLQRFPAPTAGGAARCAIPIPFLDFSMGCSREKFPPRLCRRQFAGRLRASGSGVCGSAKPRQRSRSLSARWARPSLADRDPSRLARTHPRDRQHGNHDLRPRSSPAPRAARRPAKRAVVSRRRRFLDCLAMAGFRSREVDEAGYHQSGFSESKMRLFWKRNGARPFTVFEGRL